MRRRGIIIPLLIMAMFIFTGCGDEKVRESTAAEPSQRTVSVSQGMTLLSDSFRDRAELPLSMACPEKLGQNISPHLAWSGAPAGTDSFAIVMDDESTPGCGPGDQACVHWGVFNLPVSVTSLAAGEDAGLPDGAVQGGNYKGKTGYAGPCPPATHTYKITVFALGDGAPVPVRGEALTRSQFAARFGQDILDSATIQGHFTP